MLCIRPRMLYNLLSCCGCMPVSSGVPHPGTGRGASLHESTSVSIIQPPHPDSRCYGAPCMYIYVHIYM